MNERLMENRIERFVLSSPPESFATQLPNQMLSAFVDTVARFFCHIAQMFEPSCCRAGAQCSIAKM